MKDVLSQLITFYCVLALVMNYLFPGLIHSLIGNYFWTGLYVITFRVHWAGHKLTEKDLAPIIGFAWFWPLALFFIHEVAPNNPYKK